MVESASDTLDGRRERRQRQAVMDRTPIIRALEEADRPPLRDLYRRSRIHAFAWEDPAGFADDDFDRHTAGERVLVAEVDGAVVGFASLWEPETFVHCLYVDPVALGRGIGSALLDALLAGAAMAPTLKCRRRNHAALGFYRARGWTIASGGDDTHGGFYLLRCDPPG